MTYRIILSRAAQKAIETLPLSVAHAVVEFIYGDLADNPQRVGKALQTPFDGQHSARRGSYRIRYRILEDKVLVSIVHVQHRSDAYR